MSSVQKQAPKSLTDYKGLSYFIMGGSAAFAGMVFGKGLLLLPFISVKNPQLALAITTLAATCASYAGLINIRSQESTKGILDNSVTKTIVALSFAAVANYGGYLSDKNDKQYAAERDAMPFIDSKTILGTREYNVADEHCRYKGAGVTVDFDHNGKKSYTVCPR